MSRFSCQSYGFPALRKPPSHHHSAKVDFPQNRNQKTIDVITMTLKTLMPEFKSRRGGRPPNKASLWKSDTEISTGCTRFSTNSPKADAGDHQRQDCVTLACTAPRPSLSRLEREGQLGLRLVFTGGETEIRRPTSSFQACETAGPHLPWSEVWPRDSLWPIKCERK